MFCTDDDRHSLNLRSAKVVAAEHGDRSGQPPDPVRKGVGVGRGFDSRAEEEVAPEAVFHRGQRTVDGGTIPLLLEKRREGVSASV